MTASNNASALYLLIFLNNNMNDVSIWMMFLNLLVILIPTLEHPSQTKLTFA